MEKQIGREARGERLGGRNLEGGFIPAALFPLASSLRPLARRQAAGDFPPSPFAPRVP